MKPLWQGEKLRVRRKQLGLTTAELADKTGCDRQLVSMWENDKAAPSGHFLIVLSIVLNVNPKNFYTFE